LFRNLKELSGSNASEPSSKFRNSDLIFSQFDMGIVLMAFFETIVMHPTLVVSMQ
jgi:hypothetical protein